MEKRRVRRLGLVVLLVLSSLTGSCDPSTSQNFSENAQDLRPPPKIPIMIRTMAGMRKEKAFLVAPTPDPPLDQLAAGVRHAGFRCDTGTAFSQLEDNGQTMTIYKLDCGRRSYQITVINGDTHIKRWTGNIFGQ